MLEIRDISEYQRLGLLNLPRFAAENRISLKREIERSGTQLLLNRLLNNEHYELTYTVHKKPFLKNRIEKISISHSHDLLVVMLDEKNETGVDVELMRDKVLGVKNRFLNEEELDFAGNDIPSLITMWAAKEAIYKAYGRKSLDFRTNMAVKPFSGDTLNGLLMATDKQTEFLLKREVLGEYILVYILHEIPRLP